LGHEALGRRNRVNRLVVRDRNRVYGPVVGGLLEAVGIGQIRRQFWI